MNTALVWRLDKGSEPAPLSFLLETERRPISRECCWNWFNLLPYSVNSSIYLNFKLFVANVNTGEHNSRACCTTKVSRYAWISPRCSSRIHIKKKLTNKRQAISRPQLHKIWSAEPYFSFSRYCLFSSLWPFSSP